MNAKLRALLAALGLVLVLTACSPMQVRAFNHVTQDTRQVLNEDQLYRLRWCESRDNYSIVSATGAYRGAYQFSRTTWNSVASRHFPWLNGTDPAAAAPYWQDAMARALYSEAGRSPWPHCGLQI